MDILLSQLVSRVRTDGELPPVGRGVVLVLSDQMNDASRRLVLAWARAGGSVVVADPSSPLTGASLALGLPDQALSATGDLRAQCPVPWAQSLSINPDNGPLYRVPTGATGCFGQAGAAFAVQRPYGRGVIVALGSPDLWSNAFLDRAGNAELAANLLAAGRGYQVSWVSGPIVPGGRATLWGLVPSRVKALLGALGLALLLTVFSQARRHGRPVAEAALVPLPASELVAATGRLLQANHHYQQSAVALRQQACRDLASRLGQPAGVPAATVARMAAAKYGVPEEEAMSVLAGPPPASEAELVAMTLALGKLQKVGPGPLAGPPR